MDDIYSLNFDAVNSGLATFWPQETLPQMEALLGPEDGDPHLDDLFADLEDVSGLDGFNHPEFGDHIEHFHNYAAHEVSLAFGLLSLCTSNCCGFFFNVLRARAVVDRCLSNRWCLQYD